MNQLFSRGCTIKRKLSLHSACTVAAHELFHVGNADTVKVADDAVLEAARRDGKFQRRLLVLILVQAVDQTARKAVTAADAVDDVADFVFLRDVEILSVIEARRPAVPVRAVCTEQFFS